MLINPNNTYDIGDKTPTPIENNNDAVHIPQHELYLHNGE